MEKHGVSREFLDNALKCGFDVHHIDGDHSNNDPDNLVLIFAGDHMLLHGMKTYSGRTGGKWKTAEQLHREKMQMGEEVYGLRLSGSYWDEIEIPSGMAKAKYYAENAGKPWPIQISLRRRESSKAKNPQNMEAKKRRKVTIKSLTKRQRDYIESVPKDLRNDVLEIMLSERERKLKRFDARNG